MLRQQLAQQGGASAWQAGHADEMGCHAMVLSVQRCSSDGKQGWCSHYKSDAMKRRHKKCRFETRSGTPTPP
jgi:hypothetical protein